MRRWAEWICGIVLLITISSFAVLIIEPWVRKKRTMSLQAEIVEKTGCVFKRAFDADGNIEMLDFVRSERTTWEVDLQHLQRLHHLRRIRFANCPLSDEALKHISQARSLEAIDIWNAPLTDSGVSHLKALPNLRSFLVIDAGLTDSCIDDLAQIASLKYVALAGTSVTAQGIQRLKQRLPQATIECCSSATSNCQKWRESE